VFTVTVRAVFFLGSSTGEKGGMRLTINLALSVAALAGLTFFLGGFMMGFCYSYLF